MKIDLIINYLDCSFLSPLLHDENITDISYNGKYVFYVDNRFGRKKYEIQIEENEVDIFLRQIANLSEKSFSYTTPILDIMAGRYRITAIHNSISKNEFKDCYSFSIRIASSKPRIYDGCSFLNPILEELLKEFLNLKLSIVICGITGSGKTEFQKYLISSFKNNERVIVIDNISELNNPLASTDLNIWEYNENNKQVDISFLIKTALRSNPDWLILAEARSKEMTYVLQSALTGHPIITCLHAASLKNVISRVINMILISDKQSDPKVIKSDVLSSFNVFIQIDKKIENDGSIKRYIKEIGLSNGNDIDLIYENKEKERYFKFNELYKKIFINKYSKEFRKVFFE